VPGAFLFFLTRGSLRSPLTTTQRPSGAEYLYQERKSVAGVNGTPLPPVWATARLHLTQGQPEYRLTPATVIGDWRRRLHVSPSPLTPLPPGERGTRHCPHSKRREPDNHSLNHLRFNHPHRAPGAPEESGEDEEHEDNQVDDGEVPGPVEAPAQVVAQIHWDAEAQDADDQVEPGDEGGVAGTAEAEGEQHVDTIEGGVGSDIPQERRHDVRHLAPNLRLLVAGEHWQNQRRRNRCQQTHAEHEDDGSDDSDPDASFRQVGPVFTEPLADEHARRLTDADHGDEEQGIDNEDVARRRQFRSAKPAEHGGEERPGNQVKGRLEAIGKT
jgi:hypothetical protein